jgi:16S rRNA (guanine966-N2)-methyltransferase
MRIVSGRLGGRRLRAPAGAATRPTSERVREAVFSILGPPGDDTHVLDLFAGSGAMGLEALSRGAASATFVDSGRPALTALRENIADLGLADQARVIPSDVLTFVRALSRGEAEARGSGGPAGSARGAKGRSPFAARWVFIDPPYRTDLASKVLEVLGSRPDALADDASVLVEHDRRNPPAERHGSLIRTDSRRYGDTVIAIYRQEPT